MKVFIGADHRGFELKNLLSDYISSRGYEVIDLGPNQLVPTDDYVDYAVEVVKKVSEEGRGVLICGSGHGVDMVANKYRGIRGILAFNAEVAKQGRMHEDANVASIPADWVDVEEAKEIVRLFLETDFSGEERHKRRLEKFSTLGQR